MKACPLCGAPRRLLERLAQIDRWFCNGCGHIFVIGENGVCVRWEATNHTRTASRRLRRYEPNVGETSGTFNPARVAEPRKS